MLDMCSRNRVRSWCPFHCSCNNSHSSPPHRHPLFDAGHRAAPRKRTRRRSGDAAGDAVGRPRSTRGKRSGEGRLWGRLSTKEWKLREEYFSSLTVSPRDREGTFGSDRLVKEWGELCPFCAHSMGVDNLVILWCAVTRRFFKPIILAWQVCHLLMPVIIQYLSCSIGWFYTLFLFSAIFLDF